MLFTFYRIRTFCGKALDVPGATTNDDAVIVQYDIHNQKHQNFLIFALDHGYSVIPAEHSGKVLNVSQKDWSYPIPKPYTPIIQYQFGNGENEKFLIKNNGSIEAKHNGKVFDVRGSSTQVDTPIIEHEFRNTANQKFIFDRVKSFRVSVPQKQKLPDLPILSSIDDDAPAETARAKTGSALMPCIMVLDGLSLPRRMQESPYYILVKNQFWKRLWHDTFLPGEGLEQKETTGMAKTVQETMTQTTNISLQADFGFAFKALTLGIGASISRSIEISTSTTDTVMSETTTTRNYKNENNFKIAWAKYALATEFILMRKNGTIAGSWEAVDKTVTRSISYPPTQTLSCSNNTEDYNDDTTFLSTTITSE